MLRTKCATILATPIRASMWSVLSLSLCDIGYWSLYYSTIGHCTVLCDIGYWSRNNWATFTMHTSFLKAWRSFTNFFGGKMCVICTLDPQIIMIIFWQKLWPKLVLFFCPVWLSLLGNDWCERYQTASSLSLFWFFANDWLDWTRPDCNLSSFATW